MRRTVALFACVIAIAPAAAAADGGPTPPTETGWDGIAAPDGAVRYVALPAARETVVAKVRAADGRVLLFGSMPGSYGIPRATFGSDVQGLTRDGKLLFLAPNTGGPTLPKETTLVAVSTQTLSVARRITLPGAFSFDALSPDARTLYLIQHVNARGDLSHYLVRAYDLEQGRLRQQPVVDRVEQESEMAGYPLARAVARDGSWVYTLYQDDAQPTPFVHALDTVHGLAVCVDLPWRYATQDAVWKLRLSVGGDPRVLALRWSDGRAFGTVDVGGRRFTPGSSHSGA
jgi:hypothetical protein